MRWTILKIWNKLDGISVISTDFFLIWRNCSFLKINNGNANKMATANISKDVWYTNESKFAPKPVSNDICLQISTYRQFLERNINVVLANASCIPRESSYTGHMTPYNASAKLMKNRKYERWVRMKNHLP